MPITRCHGAGRFGLGVAGALTACLSAPVWAFSSPEPPLEFSAAPVLEPAPSPTREAWSWLPTGASRAAGWSLSDGLRLEYGRTSAAGGEAGALGTAAVGARDARRMDLHDVDLSWDLWDAGPMTLSAIGGLRAMSYEGEPGGPEPEPDTAGLAVTPVVGVGGLWAIAPGVAVGGRGALPASGDDTREFLDVRTEIGFDLAENVGLFVGYQRLRAWVTNGEVVAEANRDAVFARLELRF